MSVGNVDEMVNGFKLRWMGWYRMNDEEEVE